MRGSEPLVRFYGLREIGAGLGILLSKDPTPRIWGRVAGDALDLATLAAAFTDNNPKRPNVALALGNVAGITALDVYCARRLERSRKSASALVARDYRRRSGFPRPASEMRGATAGEMPDDFRAPSALRPFTVG